ncbi:MAG: MBL fold metallo-hydrolase, partial [Mesorhizobium sp.]
MTEEDWLVPRLASIGMSTSDISHVVQSHLHFDHAGGLEWLTHAKVYVQRDELAFARNPP